MRHSCCAAVAKLLLQYGYSMTAFSVPQEQNPCAFGAEVAESSRKVLHVRYTLLPYLYTLFYHVHINGGTVMRPLVNE